MIGIAVVLTLIVRWQYTSVTRDNHLWNRRKFAQMGGPPTVPTCATIDASFSELSSGARSAYNKASQIASDSSNALNSAYTSLETGARTISNNLSSDKKSSTSGFIGSISY
jgi:hypothetical protein